jgi:hypothetical protein
MSRSRSRRSLSGGEMEGQKRRGLCPIDAMAGREHDVAHGVPLCHGRGALVRGWWANEPIQAGDVRDARTAMPWRCFLGA